MGPTAAEQHTEASRREGLAGKRNDNLDQVLQISQVQLTNQVLQISRGFDLVQQISQGFDQVRLTKCHKLAGALIKAANQPSAANQLPQVS